MASPCSIRSVMIVLAYVLLSGTLAISYTLMIPPVEFAVRPLISNILYLRHTF